MSLDAIDGQPSLPANQVLHCALRGRSKQSYFVYVPSSGSVDAPLFVAIHGVSRNALEIAHSFSSFCEVSGAVLVAPLFSEEFKDYQRLGRNGRGPRSDTALESILDEVVQMTGAAAAPIYLFGQSGGAQFAHRYAMAHPHRVARAVFVAAGWYTFPAKRRRFPYGIRRTRDLPDVRFDPEEFLSVPMTVIVGEADTGTENLRSSRRVIRLQGATRIERAQNWVNAMHKAAKAHRMDPLASLESIPGGDHDFAKLMASGLGERVFAALLGAHVATPKGKSHE